MYCLISAAQTSIFSSETYSDFLHESATFSNEFIGVFLRTTLSKYIQVDYLRICLELNCSLVIGNSLQAHSIIHVTKSSPILKGNIGSGPVNSFVYFLSFFDFSVDREITYFFVAVAIFMPFFTSKKAFFI